jgi:flavodoxin
MSDQKTLIICQSIHHGNTMKVAEVLAEALNAEVKKPSEITAEEVDKYDLVGFGSGIYNDKHHLGLIALAEKLPINPAKKAFIFSTSGIPVAIFGNKFMQNYLPKAHSALKNVLLSKEYKIVAEDLMMPGFNTNVFLKYFGGVNKGRPDENDLNRAREFANKIKNANMQSA